MDIRDTKPLISMAAWSALQVQIKDPKIVPLKIVRSMRHRYKCCSSLQYVVSTHENWVKYMVGGFSYLRKVRSIQTSPAGVRFSPRTIVLIITLPDHVSSILSTKMTSSWGRGQQDRTALKMKAECLSMPPSFLAAVSVGSISLATDSLA